MVRRVHGDDVTNRELRKYFALLDTLDSDQLITLAALHFKMAVEKIKQEDRPPTRKGRTA